MVAAIYLRTQNGLTLPRERSFQLDVTVLGSSLQSDDTFPFSMHHFKTVPLSTLVSTALPYF